MSKWVYAWLTTMAGTRSPQVKIKRNRLVLRLLLLRDKAPQQVGQCSCIPPYTSDTICFVIYYYYFIDFKNILYDRRCIVWTCLLSVETVCRIKLRLKKKMSSCWRNASRRFTAFFRFLGWSNENSNCWCCWATALYRWVTHVKDDGYATFVPEEKVYRGWLRRKTFHSFPSLSGFFERWYKNSPRYTGEVPL